MCFAIVIYFETTCTCIYCVLCHSDIFWDNSGLQLTTSMYSLLPPSQMQGNNYCLHVLQRHENLKASRIKIAKYNKIGSKERRHGSAWPLKIINEGSCLKGSSQAHYQFFSRPINAAFISLLILCNLPTSMESCDHGKHLLYTCMHTHFQSLLPLYYHMTMVLMNHHSIFPRYSLHK